MSSKASIVELWLRAGLYWCDLHAKDIYCEIMLKDSRGFEYGKVTLVGASWDSLNAWVYKHIAIGIPSLLVPVFGRLASVEAAQAEVFRVARARIEECWP